MARPYPVTGIVTDAGVQPRLEVRALQNNRIQFSLFIQALNKVLKMNNENPQSDNYINKANSWWQMGSIHGLPYNKWSGDPEGPEYKEPNEQWMGYCYHAAALFPPWHRVLLLLVEQAVVNEAIAIASGLNNDEWLQEAKKLRFPFWDWTNRQTAEEGIPVIFREPQIRITYADGSSASVDNPLNRYEFTLKPGPTENAPYMDTWQRTYRWANRDLNPTEEQYDLARRAFSEGITIQLGGRQRDLKPVGWLREKIAALFAYPLVLQDPLYRGNMWGYFSNTSVTGDTGDRLASLEEPHNMVHLDTGGNGSMSFGEYAGFDPIFFLHHCNVDRIYAFWEYIYPEYWIGNGWWSQKENKLVPFVTDEGTFVQPAGSQVDHTTALSPFRINSSDYWTPDRIRGLLSTSPVNKYYTYPAIQGVNVHVPYDVNDIALRDRYRRILFNEFGPILPALIDSHQQLSSVSRQTNLLTDLLLKKEGEFVHLRHFFFIGEVPEFAFPGSYRLELYLLEKDRHLPKGNVVNSISVFGRADPDRCAACRERLAAGSHVHGHMPLDPELILHLIERLDLTQLERVSTLDHLAVLIHASLGMRLVKPDGTRLAAADPYVPADYSKHLDASKTPKLTLHSHVIKLNHKDSTAPVSFDEQAHHGTFGTGFEWKAI